MSTDIRHRGRPHGARREALKSWMTDRTSFTMGEVSRSLGWPIANANLTLQRAVAAGDVRVCGQVRIPQAKRPVALYVSATMHDAGAGGPALLSDCLSRWLR